MGVFVILVTEKRCFACVFCFCHLEVVFCVCFLFLSPRGGVLRVFLVFLHREAVFCVCFWFFVTEKRCFACVFGFSSPRSGVLRVFLSPRGGVLRVFLVFLHRETRKTPLLGDKKPKTHAKHRFSVKKNQKRGVLRVRKSHVI